MNCYLIVFLVTPLVLLTIRECLGRRLSVWPLFILYVAIGWLLINLALAASNSALEEAVRQNPTEELLNRLQNDGAANVFTFYLGWAYAAIYFCANLVVLRLLKLAVRRQSI